MADAAQVWVVDDDRSVSFVLAAALGEAGFGVTAFADAAEVLAVMHRNVALANQVVRRFAASLPARRSASPIDTALDHAVMTAPAARDRALIACLHAVAGRVLG